ncbi:MAG TPA: energy-coupling factor transporter transmembrane component T [Ktedonobacteraceae bacterium]|nr:energy-coupling factor transporter transmembrane component T [Ktedonobacteraceae bacterium]
MFNLVALGVYYPGNSIMHRLQARTKLLLIVWFAVLFTIANQRFFHFAPYLLAIALVFGSIALGGISPGYMWRRLRLLILFSVIGIIPTLLFFSSSDQTHPPLGTYGPLLLPNGGLRLVIVGYGVALLLLLLAMFLPAMRNARQSRWFKRLRVLLIVLVVIGAIFLWVTRDLSPAATLPLGPFILASDSVWLIFSLFVVFLSLYSFSLILTMTTSPIALIEGLTILLTPLRWLRLPVDDFALMMLIALRFIPTLLEEVELLVKAQLSRGADLAHGSLRERIQSLAALFIPFVQGTLRRAADLAIALEARGYEVEGRQTLLHERALQRVDYVIIGMVFVLTIGTLLI